MAFWSQWISQGLHVFVALVWLGPDRRIEIALVDKETWGIKDSVVRAESLR